MGYIQNLQKYIIKIEKTIEEADWTFNRNTDVDTQQFHFGVSFQFVSHDEMNVTKHSFVADLLYPVFGSKSGAVSAMTSTATLGLAAMIIAY